MSNLDGLEIVRVEVVVDRRKSLAQILAPILSAGSHYRGRKLVLNNSIRQVASRAPIIEGVGKEKVNLVFFKVDTDVTLSSADKMRKKYGLVRDLAAQVQHNISDPEFFDNHRNGDLWKSDDGSQEGALFETHTGSVPSGDSSGYGDRDDGGSVSVDFRYIQFMDSYYLGIMNNTLKCYGIWLCGREV